MKSVLTILTVSLVLSLAACSDNIKPPPPLEDITPTLKVRAAWVFKSGDTISGQHSQLMPALEGNSIYVANANGKLASLDTGTGSEQWLAKTDSEFSSGVGLGSDAVAVGARDGHVILFNKQDGTVRWQVALSSEVLAAPLILDDVVIAETIDGKVYGLDRSNGSRIWIYEQRVPSLSLRGNSELKIAGDRILVAFDSGVLAALNRRTGEPFWETTVATPVGRNDLDRIVDSDGQFEVFDGVIYVTTYQGRVAAINLQNGAILWSREMSSYAGLTVTPTQVLVSDAESHIWALDRNSGATLWRQDKLAGRDITAPSLLGDRIVVGDRGGFVHWLAIEDGHFLARARLNYAFRDLGSHWWIRDGYIPPRYDPVVTSAPRNQNNELFVHDDSGVLTLYRIVGESS